VAKIQGESILVQVPGQQEDEPDRTATHALIRFGAMGYVGRFRFEHRFDIDRGSRVVVQSSRGLEIGEVLWIGGADSALVQDQPDSGMVLRATTAEDAATERLLRASVLPAFEACRQLIEQRGVPVDLVDAEQLLDGQTIIFYFLGDPPPVLADITAELTGRFEAHVQFRPFGERMAHDCGACGNDNGGCGHCSADGTCGKGHSEEGSADLP
jgi:cell fate regulator YaaT (PSP1 superfamily)